MSEILTDNMTSIAEFCRHAISTTRHGGPGRAIVISANTVQKAIAAETPLALGAARPYLSRCGYVMVLYHDTEDRYWDILYKVADRSIVYVKSWDGPAVPESLLDTAFCCYDEDSYE